MPTDSGPPDEQPKDEATGPPPPPADRPAPPSSSPLIRLDSGISGGRPSDSHVGVDGAPLVQEDRPTHLERIKTLLIGKPRDLADKSIFKHISLVAFLAWVGLGADGLSSSCYGPAEAFINLGEHSYLAVFLALAIIGTVFVICACYSHIIEAFPSGGGGYLVASKLLGNRVGVVSGCALLIDYVMTITVSIAASGDALFSLLGEAWQPMKLPAEFAAIAFLIVLNLRGVKESVQILMPIFLVFLLTHAVLICGTIGLHTADIGQRTQEITAQVQTGIHDPNLGLFAMLALLLHAYSLGAGTFTGLEAVSNSMPVIREPRVHNAKKTMFYMAVSLAFAAGGLIVAYLLLDIRPSHDGQQTMNFLLTRTFVDETGMAANWSGGAFLFVTLLSEGALLVVAAQAGFIGGPQLMANMAHDSWMPRWFANLSERFAAHNGVLLMGAAALIALMYTGGHVGKLVIMYSINVFVTFSLSMIGMCRHWFALRNEHPLWRRRLTLFVCGAVLCVSILCVTVVQKFTEGGWLTLAVTGACVAVSFGIHRYYRQVGLRLKRLDETLGQLAATGEPAAGEPDPNLPTAVVLVGGYSGIGIHTMLNAIRFAPDHFRSFIFISVGVIDSGNFKGSSELEALQKHTEDSLQKYCDLARRLGMPAASFMAIDTDAVDGLEAVCLEVAQKYPKATFFAGQLVFQKDSWLHRVLHNQTAYMLQRRLQWIGLPMVILPTRVR